MLFTEPLFIFFFFPLLIWFYLIIPREFKNLLLLVFSILFYAIGEKEYTVIMLFSITINYILALFVASKHSQKQRKIFFILAILINLGLLIFFKYANFFVNNLNILLQFLGNNPIELAPIHLPIGISFFTFQAMSYVIDVYRQEVKEQKNLLNVGLYVSLFPQLIAGPIVRYETIATEINERFVNRKMFAEGIQRFILGLGKKMIIANTVAYPADQIFSLPSSELTMTIAWLGIICYTLQIYFDFSGYSDMAIGLGKMFGFHFCENFNYPYIAKSVTDFWRRWHISLSTWFRDYLYIPLGGNRISPQRTYLNLIIVFVLCGLWHGANWGFIFWGLYHGFFLVLERLGWNKIIAKMIPLFQHCYTMLTVMIGWVFFRIATQPNGHDNLFIHGLKYCGAMFGLHNQDSFRSLAEYSNHYLFMIILVGVFASTPIYNYFNNSFHFMTNQWSLWQEIVIKMYLFLILIFCSFLIASDSYNPFIYFQF